MKRVRKSFRQHLLLLLLSVSLGMPAIADDLLRDGHPERYTVVKGDTLWDIAGRFLRNPWRWPDIWYVNPQIRNPHLIYPGDMLELVYVNGKPQLTLSRGPRHVKLSPGIRSKPWDGAIPTVPVDAIAPFLTRPYVLNAGEADASPYIVAFANDHIIGGAGQKAYVRSISEEAAKFHVVRPGDAYRDAESGELLGYEATFIGSVESLRSGDPGTVFFNKTERESLIGDRLVSINVERPWTNFTPKRPNGDIEGSIISVVDGVSQIGQYDVVVIDRGERDGLTPGDVLRIDQRGETIRDTVTRNSRDTVTLPDEKAGLMMVFRTFERVSFGLVMNATNAIHVLDRVRTP
jgi:hypothetical protein